jgi:hypothetical protein
VTPWWTIGDAGPWRGEIGTVLEGNIRTSYLMLDFLTGRQETSKREHVLLFLGQRLMAIKWRNFKIHLEGLDRVDGVFEDWSFPRGFNLAADPKERWNILWAEHVDRRAGGSVRRRLSSEREKVSESCDGSAQQPATTLRQGRSVGGNRR